HTRFSRDWSSDVCSSDLPWRSGFHHLWSSEPAVAGRAEGDLRYRVRLLGFRHPRPKRQRPLPTGTAVCEVRFLIDPSISRLKNSASGRSFFMVAEKSFASSIKGKDRKFRHENA